MADVKLDPLTHDIVVENYDVLLVTGVDLIVQRLRQRLWFFMGEWYLAINEGVPYYQEILRKGVTRERVESALKRAIVTTPGVLELVRFNLTYAPGTRQTSVDFSCRVENDEVLELQVTL